MRNTDAVVIGAGQAGLAMSHCLGRLGIEHVVLERGRLGERWRSERWDSLRMLTPNWMSRLPGWSYRGTEPDGYMSMAEVIGYLEGYARSFAAPVITGTDVCAVRRAADGFRVETSDGAWAARAVVVASGQCDVPRVPGMAARLAPAISQLSPSTYRNPALLAPGGVLVVGASASGVQIADELQRAGRQVTLAVGRHTRLPRLYRGQDILWWMDQAGVLDEPAENIRDLRAARRQPSLQLVGSAERRSIDIGSLHRLGVCILGRLLDLDGKRARFADDLVDTTAAAHRRLQRLLGRIDMVADLVAAPREPWPPALPTVERTAASLDLAASGIRTVIWATGFRRDLPWLCLPGLFDSEGEARHSGGVTPVGGLYLIGMRFLRRRNSSFLDGVGRDAAELAMEVRRYLATTVRAAA